MFRHLRAMLAALGLVPLGGAAWATTYSFDLAVLGLVDVDTGALLPDPGGVFAGTGQATLTLNGVDPSLAFQDFDETDIAALSVTLYGQNFGAAELANISNSTVPPPFEGPGVAFDAETVNGNLTAFVFGFTEVARVASPTGGVFEYTPGSLIAIDEPGVLAFTGTYGTPFPAPPIAPDGRGPASVAIATTPIPLPGGMGLALAGIAALVALRRKARPAAQG